MFQHDSLINGGFTPKFSMEFKPIFESSQYDIVLSFPIVENKIKACNNFFF